MTEEKQKIFLEDNSILPWECPKGEELRWLPQYKGFTTLIRQIGFDTIDETIGPVKIIGSSTKYLADIRHSSPKGTVPVSSEKKREILFSGGLAIYRVGQIPGTEIRGYDLEKHGRIWVTRSIQDKFYNSAGLKNLIFENALNSINRIEAILLGYRTQDDKRKLAQNKMEHEHFEMERELRMQHPMARYYEGPQ